MRHNGLTAVQLNIIKTTLKPFAQKIQHVGLFGSRATGQYRDNSDIDMVIYGTLTEQEIARLWTLFDNSPLAIKVDLHAYDQISYPPLKAHIDAVMQPLFTQEELHGSQLA